MRIALFLIFATLTLLPISASHAYIGPGLGAGTIGVVLGILGSIALALFAVIWYPIKRLMKRKKRAGDAPDDPARNQDLK